MKLSATALGQHLRSGSCFGPIRRTAEAGEAHCPNPARRDPKRESMQAVANVGPRRWQSYEYQFPVICSETAQPRNCRARTLMTTARLQPSASSVLSFVVLVAVVVDILGTPVRRRA